MTHEFYQMTYKLVTQNKTTGKEAKHTLEKYSRLSRSKRIVSGNLP